MNKKDIIQTFSLLAQSNSAPTTELVYSSPFELLVAVVLSAQATDVSVNKATKELFKVANTPKKMINLGVEKLEQYIKTIGLYKTKAKNVIALSQLLIENYKNCIPENFAELIKLPGVGRKTANVILNTLFGHNTIAVDTHVFRVSKRLGLASGNTVESVEEELMTVVPDQFKQNAHHWLILHGRYTCTARTPKCDDCCLKPFCKYYKNL